MAAEAEDEDAVSVVFRRSTGSRVRASRWLFTNVHGVSTVAIKKKINVGRNSVLNDASQISKFQIKIFVRSFSFGVYVSKFE